MKDKWTENEFQKKDTSPINWSAFKPALNLYAFLVLSYVYVLAQEVEFHKYSITAVVETYSYIAFILIAVIGVIGYANNLKIATKKVWCWFLAVFTVFQLLYIVHCSIQLGIQAIFSSWDAILVNGGLNYLGFVIIIYAYIKSKTIWERM